MSGRRSPAPRNLYIPYITDIPFLGRVLLGQNAFVYLSVALIIGIWYFLYRTRAGLILRAVGDNHASAHALGYPVLRIRLLAVLFGGACAGLGGAYLPLAYTPFWVSGMTAGRGWIALALVVFASWLPFRLMIGAYLFGGITILQLHAQATGLGHSVAADVVAALSGDHHRAGGDFVLCAAGPGARHRPRSGLLSYRTVEHCMTARKRRMRAPRPEPEASRRTFGDRHEEILIAAAAGLAVGARARRGASAQEKLKIGFIYVGPIGDMGWSYQHEVGAARHRRAVQGQDRHELPGERQRGPRRGALDRAAGAHRPQADLHHLVRLHGRDRQGREEISERDVRARDRLQARQEPRDLFGPLLRRPLHPGPDRRQDVEDRHDRLHRLVPDPRSRLRHQRHDARRAVGAPGHEGEDHLGEHLVRPRQGSGRGARARRSGRRHPDPAHGFGRPRCSSPTSAASSRSARTPT